MNFFKISGLVIGTGSVIGGTGAGVYYGVIKNNTEENIEKVHEKQNEKIAFNGKLVFIKKTNDDNSTVYEIKLFSEEEYNDELTKFDSSANDNKTYEQINKVIEISHELNVQETKNKLNSLFETQINVADIKTKISEKETELTMLFNDEIYKNFKNKFENSDS